MTSFLVFLNTTLAALNFWLYSIAGHHWYSAASGVFSLVAVVVLIAVEMGHA